MSWWWPFGGKKPKMMIDKALLVGINAYPGAPLQGCVNDVNNMAGLLVKKYKFPAENVRLLCDKRATTAAIRERLHWLVSDLKPGSRVLFHYSGHGAQTATRAHSGEVDGLDEVICPVDFDWSDAHMIRDKEFYEIFKAVPADVKFCWVSDSCHSGDLTKEMPGKHGSIKIAKTMPTPVDVAWKVAVAKNKSLMGSREANALNVGFVSGCKSSQTSADTYMEGHPCGALTYYLIKALNTLPPTTPLDQIVAQVNRDLAANGYEQQPQCEGTRMHSPFLG
jgi:hypothetical protein